MKLSTRSANCLRNVIYGHEVWWYREAEFPIEPRMIAHLSDVELRRCWAIGPKTIAEINAWKAEAAGKK